LTTDRALRGEMLRAMRERGVQVSLCEGFGIRPGVDPRDYAADLDVVGELGGRRINVASSDRDRQRSFDGFAMLTEMAAARGLVTTIEIGPGPVRDLPAALEAVRHVGRSDFKLLVDTMHFFRFGGRVGDLAAVDPQLIGYVQLCDAPLTSRHASYMEEALHERANPGAGELPLADLVAVLPADVVVSVEVPQRSLAEAGLSARERVGLTVAAARMLLGDRAERNDMEKAR
jgi:sugar phosphate isomerase/epimerase